MTNATQPFELVLGESVDAGWQATAHPAPGAPPGSHSVDLGGSQLVDSFANGWPVTAAQLDALGALGSAGSGAFSVTITWVPQQKVWLALGISAAGIGLCLLLAILPPGLLRRRRSRGRHQAGTAAAALSVPVTEPAPRLVSPLVAPGRRSRPVHQLRPAARGGRDSAWVSTARDVRVSEAAVGRDLHAAAVYRLDKAALGVAAGDGVAAAAC